MPLIARERADSRDLLSSAFSAFFRLLPARTEWEIFGHRQCVRRASLAIFEKLRSVASLVIVLIAKVGRERLNPKSAFFRDQ